MLTFTKQQMREAVVHLYGKMVDGETDKEIMDGMGLDEETFAHVKASMFEAKSEELRARPKEHVYVKYLIDQEQNIRDLTNMLGMFKFTKQYNAMVGAVRVRAEILDKVVEKGQSFGLIEKRPDEKTITGGLVVANLSNEDLKKRVLERIESINAMMAGEPDGHFTTIDVADPYGDAPAKVVQALPPPAVMAPQANGKRSRSSSGKVYGGRRVVKKPGGKDG